MILGIGLIIMAGLLWGGVGVLNSTIARRRLNYAAICATGSAIGTAVTAAVYLDWGALLGGEATRTGELAAFVGGSTALNIIGFLLIQRAMRAGHHAGTWTIAQSAMVFPFIAGLLIWGEAPNGFRLAGIAAILIGVGAIGRGRALAVEPASHTSGPGWFIPAAIAFVLLGGHQSLMQAPSHWHGWQDVARLRVPMMLGFSAVGYGLVALWIRAWPTRGEIVLALIGAAIGIAGQMCFFPGMDRLTSRELGAAVYPIGIGTCILSFALYSLIVLREPTSRYHWIGLACCLAGIAVIIL